MSTSGFIRGALRIYSLIPNNHPIWRMCRCGDLEGVQTLLSSRQVSPFSVDTDGTTLLHIASACFQIKICEFLFNLGLNGQEVTVNGSPPWLGPLVSLDNASELLDIYSLFTVRCEYFDDKAFFKGIFSDPHLEITFEAFNSIVHGLIAPITLDAFDISPISTAMRMLWKSTPEFRCNWEQLIHQLLALGPDLHSFPMVENGTMLDQIMDIAESPFESEDVGEEWLAILESSGLDIENYLRTERLYQYDGSTPLITLHLGTSDNFYCCRGRYTIFSESSPRVSWDWYIDPEGHVSEVLHEFRNLGPMGQDLSYDYEYPERMFNWPYRYPRWQYLQPALKWSTTSEETRTLIKIFDDRFERRWLKKVEKLRRAQGIGKGPKVPGAWVD